ncbi:MAG: membrane dipeptidase, partial [Saprospiraceae bacterium]
MKSIIPLFFLLLFITNSIAQNSPNADIHSHVCLKAFHSRHSLDYDNWDKVEHQCDGENVAGWMTGKSQGVPRYSQANLEANALGNVRVLGWSITPLEKQYDNVRILNKKKKGIETMSCIAGITYQDFHFYNKGDVDYFPILLENIEFVKYGQFKTRKINGVDWSYELIKSKKHLEEIINSENKIAGILNIEGANILGRSLIFDDMSKTPEYETMVLDNLLRLKGAKPLYDFKEEVLEYPIFSMGINHFFYNGLGGQANPFKPIQNFVFKGGKATGDPITPLGKKVIQSMIDNTNGRII